MKLYKDKKGYLRVHLCKNNIKKNFQVHRLVAIEFLDNTDNKPCIDHINTIRTDNRVENLRWCTHKENVNNELTKIKKSNSRKGELNPMYGRKVSKETRDKMSKSHKGKNTWTKGRKMSEENKKKISIAIVQLGLEGDLIKIWNGCREAEEKGKFNHAHINSCCKGNRKTHKGYKWMYLSEYKEGLL